LMSKGMTSTLSPGLSGLMTLLDVSGDDSPLHRGCVCIGHGDWESQHIRWTDGDPLVVHDWDSVIAQPETAIVGLAAAVWPREGRADQTASVAQTADFITRYQHVAGREWDTSEIRGAWAAGLWVRLFDAKQEAAEGGGPQVDRLASDIDERLCQAALN
jgi:hypothetical protein